MYIFHKRLLSLVILFDVPAILKPFTLLSLLLFSVANPAQAANDFDLDNLYILCENAPLNSRCSNWDGTPLNEHPGELVNCQITPQSIATPPATTNGCKVWVTEDEITVFLEQGNPIRERDDQRATFSIAFSKDQLFSSYFSTTGGSYLGEGFNAERKGSGFVRIVELGMKLDEEAEQLNRTSFLTVYTYDDAFAKQLLELDIKEHSNSEIRQRTQAYLRESSDSASSTNISKESAINQLLETRACVRCDLSNVDLSGTDLRNTNLEGANLSGANLSEANLAQAYLVGAILDGAALIDTNLARATLVMVSLSLTTNLQGADLSGVALVLSDADSVDFSGTDLSPSDFRSPLYRRASVLSRSSLRNANFEKTQPKGSNFSHADLSNANLTGAAFTLMGVVVSYVESTTVYNVPSVFHGTNLMHANLAGASFSLADLTGASLEDANLTESIFTKAILSLANLSNANLADALLDQSSLVGTNFSHALFQNTQMNGANLTLTNLTGVDLSTSQLEDAKFCATQMPDGAIAAQDCELETE